MITEKQIIGVIPIQIKTILSDIIIYLLLISLHRSIQLKCKLNMYDKIKYVLKSHVV